jgi:hypothetical protein
MEVDGGFETCVELVRARARVMLSSMHASGNSSNNGGGSDGGGGDDAATAPACAGDGDGASSDASDDGGGSDGGGGDDAGAGAATAPAGAGDGDGASSDASDDDDASDDSDTDGAAAAAPSLAAFSSAAFWRQLVPDLTVCGARGAGFAACAPLPAALAPPALAPSLRAHGVARATVRELWAPADAPAARALCARLAAAAAVLAAAGLPPSCLLMFDEAWDVAARVGAVVAAELGADFALIGDFFTFLVDGGAGGAGWPPHRDRPLPGAGAAAIARTFLADGVTPRYVTAWVALSAAPPEASCLYFLPRAFDAGFAGGDAPGADPLAAALAAGGAAAVQRVVALPVPAASLLLFAHRTLHWGSAPLAGLRAAPPAPRVALSFAFATRGFEAPYLAGEPRGAPALAARAALVAAQAINYAHQAPLARARARLFARVFLAAEARGVFAPAFAAKTRATAQWAVFAAKHAAAPRRRGAPTAAEVALLFCARAAAEAGLAADAYL